MENSLIAIWAWLAIWLPWIGVALWQSMLASSSMDVLGKNPKLYNTLMIYTILWIALVESTVIYWLIIAFQMMWKEWLDWITAIWAWIAIGLTWFWAWYWEWKLVSETLQAVNRNPENKWKALIFMMLFITLIEVVAIYWLIISLQLLK